MWDGIVRWATLMAKVDGMDALLARIAVGDQEAMRELYLECRPR